MEFKYIKLSQGKRIYLGYFSTKKKASQAVKEALGRYYEGL